MCVTESDVGRCILKVLAGLRRFRKVGLDAGAALCAERASSGSLSVLLREGEAPSGRQVSGQLDKSPALETFGLTPQIKYIYMCLEIVVRGGWLFFGGKVGDRLYKLGGPQTLHDATAERTSALKFAAFTAATSSAIN